MVQGGLVVAAVVVLYFILPFDREWWVFGLLNVVVIAGLAPFAWSRFRRVLKSPHPMIDAVNALTRPSRCS